LFAIFSVFLATPGRIIAENITAGFRFADEPGPGSTHDAKEPGWFFSP
jgi:hypothetical protein